MMNTIVDIHADDYGYTLNTSKDILELIKKGLLDSISIIPNTSYFDESMDLLYKEIPNLPFLPLISVHINLVEGYNLSNTSLLSRDGINTSSWSDILIASIGGIKKELKNQLKKELKAQINKTDEVVSKCIEIAKKNNIPCEQKGIRIDSHTHTHSIPLVFDAIKEVIGEEHLNVEYIRNPKEPILPFITNIGLSFKPINFIKNAILNVFSKNIDNYLDDKGIQKMYMWGLVMSGEMDFDRIQIIYPKMLDIVKKHNRNLEILFHPGLALESENVDELNKTNMKDFNMSHNRSIEKEAILKIKEIVRG